MAAHARNYGCPVEFALDLIGGKWRTVILARLKDKPLRYGELRRALPAIADKMLTQRLRELAEAGFIERSGDGDDDVRRYSLTAQGQSLAPVLSRLYEWGECIAPQKGVTFRGGLQVSHRD